MPDLSHRNAWNLRTYFLIHPGLASVGGKTRRSWTLDDFREAIGDRVTPFDEVIAAIKAEDEAQELADYIKRETGGQATPAGMGTPAAA